MTSNSRPLEIDETHKLIYEGYPVTVMGQSDGDRVFHIRAIGVSANSTEEVGSFFMSSWKSYNPSFQPSAYLGDAAEAFANAALQIFFFHQNSADVLHTRIQSKLVEVLYRCKLNEINAITALRTHYDDIAKSPKTIFRVSQNDLEGMKNTRSFFYRKFSKNSDIEQYIYDLINT